MDWSLVFFSLCVSECWCREAVCLVLCGELMLFCVTVLFGGIQRGKSKISQRDIETVRFSVQPAHACIQSSIISYFGVFSFTAIQALHSAMEKQSILIVNKTKTVRQYVASNGLEIRNSHRERASSRRDMVQISLGNSRLVSLYKWVS